MIGKRVADAVVLRVQGDALFYAHMGSPRPRPGGRVAYTPVVASRLQRIVSVAVVLLLAGTPVIGAVCEALCASGGLSHLHLSGPQPPERAGLEPETGPAAHHHGAGPMADRQPAQGQSRWVAHDGPCCPDGESGPSLRATRSDAEVLVATTGFVTSLVLRPLSVRVSTPLGGSPTGKAPPLRTPGVLRV